MRRALLTITSSSLALLSVACSASGGNGVADGPSGSGAAAGVGGTGTGSAAGGGQAGVGGDGAVPGAGGGVGSGGGAAGTFYNCPAGSESLTLDLSGVQLSDPIAGASGPNSGGFFEGPVWKEGALYLSQIHFGSTPNTADIVKYTPGVGFETLISDSGSNGIALDGAGKLVTANQKAPGVVTFDPSAPTSPGVEVLKSATLNSPNDLTVHTNGTIYFTDPTHQCGNGPQCASLDNKGVYRLVPGGQPEQITTLATDPNGISLSPDQKTLYVGGNVLTAHALLDDGSVDPAGGSGQAFGGITSTDGLGVDCAGNVYAALHNTGEVKIVDASGAAVGSISGISQVTNVAFGGANNTTLFITSFGDNKGQLRTVELNVPGFPY